ncbi:hypothetical protein [Marisediminicola senii]|uniref:hypothetical protein n=1 Tax=Marisediminicola senii TaxID=2711233 RepID=UPI0013EB17E8|nr:hypothetical protein [Marisediminicola senii]
MEYITGILAVFFSGLFALSATRRGAAFARSRVELVGTGLDAVAILVVARALMPWSDVSPLLWLVPVAIAAIGVFLAVLRWSALPNLRPGRPAVRSIAYGVAHAIVLLAVLVLFLG